jgi:hypothetical protein
MQYVEFLNIMARISTPEFQTPQRESTQTETLAFKSWYLLQNGGIKVQ